MATAAAYAARVSRRTWVVGAVAGAVVLAGGGALAVDRLLPRCGDTVTSLSAAASSSPFLGAADQRAQPDRDRDRLVRTLAADPAPVGEVVGAVGYHYEQWAQVSAYDQGIGVRTRDNPDFTMLDDRTLEPRWSVQVSTPRSAYDASRRTYLVTTMPSGSAPDVVSLDADTGKRRWCATLGEVPVGGSDPFATQILDDGSVIALSPGPGSKEQVRRLDARDGSVTWERTIDADAGDFVGAVGARGVLVGGRDAAELLDDAALDRRADGNALVMLDARDGSTTWSRPLPRGEDVHVIGVDGGSGATFVQERHSGDLSGKIVAFDVDGNPSWSVVPARNSAYDVTLRGGRLLVRQQAGLSAYAASDGRRLWTRTVPARPQYFPYGFELDAVPSLDADHLLLGTTAALRTLDLRTGDLASAALPTDGINTTYWPYQVAVSAGLIAVATNTGAVVVRRE